jgi:hypothetical protein
MTPRLPLALVLLGTAHAVATPPTSLLGRAATSALAAQAATDPCRTPANRIVAENCKPGNPATEWDVNGSGDPRIQGFATDISVNAGETIAFKVKSDSRVYRLDIYRIGYYGGMGARKVDGIKPSASLPQSQPECLSDAPTRLYDCGNWAVSASWRVPADAVSGIYLARLVREDVEPLNWRADNSGSERITPKPPAGPHAYGAAGYGKLANALKEPRASLIYFVVRDDASRASLLFKTSDTAWQAYNRYGGTSTYGSFDPRNPQPRAYKVSYNRPFENRDYRAVNILFNAEYPMVRWLEANGYDITYSTGVDADRRGALLKNHKVVLAVGHDEYWSAAERVNVTAARDAGVHLAFFSGNDLFWKIRWENSTDASKTPYRTLVTYKETHDNKKIDPLPNVWTGTWRDARPFNPEGAQPENALLGTIFTVNAWRNDPLVVPAEFAKLRFWRSTDVAKLQPGTHLALGNGIIGHEFNEDLDNGFRPAGLMRLSQTTINNVAYIQDYGTIYDSGTATHSATLYRAASGALVFSAGTVQWAWGLDPNHDTETGVPPERANPGGSIRVGLDLKGAVPAMQQATVNLFADMGVQPATLQPGLVPATASSDVTPPQASITSPADGTAILADAITVSGTASDRDGIVSAVEVSLDGGTRWHPAVGTSMWTYSEPSAAGATGLRIVARAVDDSGNISPPTPVVTVKVGRATR